MISVYIIVKRQSKKFLNGDLIYALTIIQWINRKFDVFKAFHVILGWSLWILKCVNMHIFELVFIFASWSKTILKMAFNLTQMMLRAIYLLEILQMNSTTYLYCLNHGLATNLNCNEVYHHWNLFQISLKKLTFILIELKTCSTFLQPYQSG